MINRLIRKLLFEIDTNSHVQFFPKKRLLAVIFSLLFINTAFAQRTTIRKSLYFESDEAIITESESQKLNKLWESIKSDTILRIYIQGHTDNSADSQYNIDLSKRRCDAVFRFFHEKEVPKSSFRINYYGEDKPKAPNKSPDGKQENRRVDVRLIIQKVKKTKTEPVKPIVPIDTCKGRDTLVVLDNGTEVVFNRCEYLEIKDCIHIKSIKSREELVESNLGLQTDQEVPLITCGMVSVCLDTSCGISKTCFDYPLKVRFPFPADNEECLPCGIRTARIFNVNSEGTWTRAGRKAGKIKIVKSKGVVYYELEIFCPDCGGFTNCDCEQPSCEDFPWRMRRKLCPKVKLKLPRKYTFLAARISVDCPVTYFEFYHNKWMRKNIARSETKCVRGEKIIKVWAVNQNGDTIQTNWEPLEEVFHRRVPLPQCGKDKIQKDPQKVWGMISRPKRGTYRKYIVRKNDFLPPISHESKSGTQ